MTISTNISSLLRHPEQGYVLVAGLGVSGISIARFLKSKGLHVVAADSNPSRTEEATALEALGIRCEIGSHRAETFENAALIVTSPGIPLDMEYFNRARSKGVVVTGELDLFSVFLKQPLVAVTGTNGKTTVTTLISEMLKASGLDVFTGGNIGTPLVDYLTSDTTAHVVVAELSSFQLDAATDFIPDVGVLLNIAEDHLDRYPDFDGYVQSKWSLFNNQSQSCAAVVNVGLNDLAARKSGLNSRFMTFGPAGEGGGDSATMATGHPAGEGGQNSATHTHFSPAGEGRGGNSPAHTDFSPEGEGRVGYSATIATDAITLINETDHHCLDLSAVRLKGAHNRENLAAAALATLAAGGNIIGIEAVIAGFSGLPHRTQYVATVDGVDYYNDSKGTNPHAVMGALKGFDRVVLIIGGRSKQTDFSCLIPLVKERVKAIIAIGEAKEEIETALRGAARIMMADAMAEAVTTAQRVSVPGDIVLLSPGCSSFDMYKNYGHRGNDFTDLVNQLDPQATGTGTG
ncbi:MAG: UDP-N-acetylmuramoyl-L-alanine--D-glutamate ligase [Desulfobacterium sp.]|nr:UDP-N-acetylmuramoyl-L-alanine--D-glutamate ligase [Desulfobacterium sp.]